MRITTPLFVTFESTLTTIFRINALLTFKVCSNRIISTSRKLKDSPKTGVWAAPYLANCVFSLVVGVMSSPCQLSCVLPYDAESKMGDARSLYHSDFLQFNALSANIFEQSDPFAEHYRHEVKIYFV